ncbi:MAG TPA: hypothetical protein VJQ43_05035, partial [Thermoplasmata archaeon]|nr:hypothetical protein [Thermoplasmata archaeon]
VDALGALVPGYSGETYLRVSPDCGPGWVNDSSGPVEGTNGTFAFPAVNWSRTALNLTVTATVSGACDVSAWSTEFPARVGDRFDVAADAAHLHLARPEVVRGGPSENATLYTVLDRFGNPDLSGYLIVVSRFGSLIEQVDSEIHGANGSAKVWVNYTAQGSGGGTLTVLNESGVAIFGPLTIPPPSLPPTLPSLVWGLLGVAAIAAAVAGIVVLRRRSRGGALATRPEDPEDPLRRLAEGRSHVLSRLSADQDADLDEIAAGCPGRPPDAAEIAEWVGTLVTEGVVRASVGLDGRPRFRLAGTEERSSGPRVEIDPMALDAALARRDHDSAEEPPG